MLPDFTHDRISNRFSIIWVERLPAVCLSEIEHRYPLPVLQDTTPARWVAHDQRGIQ
jgi:hypothetical protein